MKIGKKINTHVFWILQLLVSIFLFISLYQYLPMKYRIALALVLLLLFALTLFTQISKKIHKGAKIGGKILAVVLSVAMLTGNFVFINRANSMIAKISEGNVKTTVVSVIVKKDSAIQKENDLYGKHFGIMKKADRENTDFMLNNLSGKLENEIETTEYMDAGEMIEALMGDKVDAIVMNEGFRESFNLIDSSFESKTKVVCQVNRKEELKNLKNAEVTKEPFIAYISGIDTNGPITTTSRSDVNMIMAVNPIKKEIAMVFIPRDYYVPLQCSNGNCETGAMDKLTHAGMYGIETSEATISKLLNIEINYNVRINFDTLVAMVDALGGIDIYSDQDVDLLHGEGCNIVKGTQHVDGRCALGFARERYAYLSGDRHRGENQQEVIRAMIAKLSTKNVLNNYQEIMKAVEGMFQTNLTDNEIKALIAMQLDDLASWKVNSVSVDGTGKMTSTYSFGEQPLYVMVPDEQTVEAAKTAIQEVLK